MARTKPTPHKCCIGKSGRKEKPVIKPVIRSPCGSKGLRRLYGDVDRFALSNGWIIRRPRFQRVVREVVADCGAVHMRMEVSAVAALQMLTEAYMCGLLEDANAIMMHREYTRTRPVRCVGSPDCQSAAWGSMHCECCRREVVLRDAVVERQDLALALRLRANHV